MNGFISGEGTQKWTAAFGTRIQVVLGGLILRAWTHVVNLNYSAGGTAHTGTLMRGASRSTVVGAVAAAATSITTAAKLLDGAGGDIAANDVICAQLDDGTWFLTTVSALDATKTIITTNDAVPTGRTIPDGNKIVEYGLAGDAMHAHQQFTLASGGTTNLPSSGGPCSVCKASMNGEPIVFDSNNATAAGTLNLACVAYSTD